MTPFALRLCFHDPGRDAPDYGGERTTFVVMAATLGEALTRWLDRAAERGVMLHVVETAAPIARDELSDLVKAAKAGGIAAGASYPYPPLDPAKGVVFGLVETGRAVSEVGVKAPETGAALAAVFAHAAEEGLDITKIEGLCDLSQATEEATFNGQPLTMAALKIGLSAPGTVTFGAEYALEDE